MNSGYKYQLEPYRGQQTRYTCPQCGKKRNFARYIDVNGDYLGDDIGRCNSEVSCAYHKPPDGNGVVSGGGFIHVERPTSFLRNKDLIGEKYNDSLFKFLCKKFRRNEVAMAYDKYHVKSTNVKWNNSTVFYQIDYSGRFRTGKIIQYDSDSGKRIKVPYSRIYWVHNLITDIEFNLGQCLFGEHLLKSYEGDKIYLVESEKTCIIASLFYKDSLFLATGGLSNLNPKKLEVLKWKNVEAIPDKGGYDIWKKKLEPLGITVNAVMEESDAPDGSDLADLLID